MSEQISLAQEVLGSIKAAEDAYDAVKSNWHTADIRGYTLLQSPSVLAAHQTLTDEVRRNILMLLAYRNYLIVSLFSKAKLEDERESRRQIVETDEAIQDVSARYPELVIAARKEFYL